MLKKLITNIKRWLLGTRYPISYQATDAVIINEVTNTILLVRKPTQKKFRFVGGFVDPKDICLEVACRREVLEETGLEVSFPKYVASFRVNDPRYRGKIDQIMSAIFVTYRIFGCVQLRDDLKGGEYKWVPIEDFRKNYQNDLVDEHWAIAELLIKNNII